MRGGGGGWGAGPGRLRAFSVRKKFIGGFKKGGQSIGCIYERVFIFTRERGQHNCKPIYKTLSVNIVWRKCAGTVGKKIGVALLERIS